MLGTEPSARMQCEPSTVRPSVSVTVTAVAVIGSTDSIRELRQHVHAASGQHLLEHRGRVGVLAGQHPVAAGDQGDRGCRARGSAEANSAPVTPEPTTISSVGHLVEVVDLLPGQDPLAVGLRGRQRPRRGAGGDQHRVGARALLAVARPPTRSGPSSRPRPATTATPSFSSRRAMSADCVGGQLLDPRG